MQIPKHVHFVGIGGFGMSAIARILQQQGYAISGSDRAENGFTKSLAEQGVRVFIGHRAENVVPETEALVVTSAVNEQHIEIIEARRRGLPVYKRSNVIDALMQNKACLAIAGTHGKTTTTAMTAHILREVGQEPSYIVGGVLANTGDNASNGNGRAFVIEADEYDNMFHGLCPQIAVLTSAEYDHPDFFKTEADMIDSFSHFLDLVEGKIVGYGGDEGVRNVLANRPNAVFYGWRNDEHPALWQVGKPVYHNNVMTATVYYNGKALGDMLLKVVGNHNALNALASIAVTQSQGVTFAQASRALSTFAGTGRRFELRQDSDDIAIIDDYAHHPTAIKTTINAARNRYPNRQIWAIWQPHTYSRTEQLLGDYLAAFDEAHHVVITDIFASREAFTEAIHSENIVKQLAHPSVYYGGSLASTTSLLLDKVKAPAVLLIMSAGDAPTIGKDFITAKQECV